MTHNDAVRTTLRIHEDCDYAEFCRALDLDPDEHYARTKWNDFLTGWTKLRPMLSDLLYHFSQQVNP